MGAHLVSPATKTSFCNDCIEKEVSVEVPVEIGHADCKGAQDTHFSVEGNASDGGGGDGMAILDLEEASWEADEAWKPASLQSCSSKELETQKEEAIEAALLRQAMAIEEIGHAVTLLMVGQRRHMRGDLDGALQCIEMALVSHKSTSTDGLRVLLALLNGKGIVLYGKGQGEHALKEYKKAHQMCKVLGLLEEVQESVLLTNIGLAHMLLGDTESASEYLSKALVIQKIHNRLCTLSGVRLMERIADIKLEMGDLNSAFELYAAALANYQTMDRLERIEGARLLTKMGTIDRMQLHFQTALQKYTHAASILLRAKAKDTMAFARVQGDIGIARRELGELSSARTAFQQALAVRVRAETLNTFDGMMLLMNYGTTLRLLEDDQGALDQYSQAREIRQQSGTTPVPADVHLLVLISESAYKLDLQQLAIESFLEAQHIRKCLKMPQTAEGERMLKVIGKRLRTSVCEDSDEEMSDDMSAASPTAIVSCHADPVYACVGQGPADSATASTISSYSSMSFFSKS